MPETIKAAELPIVNIFNDAYRFSIPDYQRPYSWTTEQTGELLDDLLYAVGQSNDVTDSSPYFLGSVVIIKKDNSPHAAIVDGQQRLTTLTILLCALRDLAGANSSYIHEYIQTPERPFAGIKGHFRLTLRERDSKFFQDRIQTEDRMHDFIETPPADLTDSQRRMFENADHLWKELAKIDDDRRNALTS